MTESRGPKVDRRLSRTGWMRTSVLGGIGGLFGCGNADSLPKLQVYEVKGKVLLADGKPLPSGLISFVPKGDLPITPSAKIASDGTLFAGDRRVGRGSASGEYKVRIEAPELRPDPRTRKRSFRPSTPTKTVRASSSRCCQKKTTWIQFG